MKSAKFEVRPAPTTEEYGGPPDYGPESFIQTGGYGVLGCYGFDGETLVLVYQGFGLGEVLAALKKSSGRHLTDDQFAADPNASWGHLAMEPQADGSVRVEYQPFVHRGREIHVSEPPCSDDELQAAFESYNDSPPGLRLPGSERSGAPEFRLLGALGSGGSSAVAPGPTSLDTCEVSARAVRDHLFEGRVLVMSARQGFSAEEARQAGDAIGIDWAKAPFDVEQFRRGMDVELEHGLRDRATNVTDDDPAFTAKIALAHLNEFPDYYTRLQRMEQEATRERRGDSA